MKNKAFASARLGIFVFIGALLLLVAVYVIGQNQELFKKTFRISAVFKDVSGLQPGNNVRFSGLDVGIVKDVYQVTDTSVRVDMQVEEGTRKFIKANSIASIGTDGLMGNKIVIIAPGTGNGPVIQNDETIRAAVPINFDDVLSKLKTTGDNAASITDDLAVIIKNIRNGKGTIGMLFSDTVFAHNLGSTVVNAKEGAQGFNRNMQAASKSFLLKGLIKKNEKEKEKKKEKEQEQKEDDKK